MKKVKNTAIFCGIVSMVATIAFYLLAFEDLFNQPNGWLPLILLLVAEVVGIVKVFAAASTAVCHMDKISQLDDKTKRRLSKLNKKYKSIILDNGERKIDTIANIVGRDYNTTRQDIQSLINQEILRNAFINDIKREVMFMTATGSHTGCGAPNVHLHVSQISNASANPSTDNNITLNKQGSDNSSNHNNASPDVTASVVETESTGNVNHAPATIVVPTIRPRVVACPCCGANNIVAGDIGQCDYCLTPLA